MKRGTAVYHETLDRRRLFRGVALALNAKPMYFGCRERTNLVSECDYYGGASIFIWVILWNQW